VLKKPSQDGDKKTLVFQGFGGVVFDVRKTIVFNND
jgi:hypothetical protein